MPATNAFPEGSFLNTLYEPLDASLDPTNAYDSPYAFPGTNLELAAPSVGGTSNPYPSPGMNMPMPAPSIAVPANPYPSPGTNTLTSAPSIPNTINPYPSQGKTLEFPAPSVAVPINNGPVTPAISQQASEDAHSWAFPVNHNVSAPDPAKASDERSNVRGQKRKGDDSDDTVAKLAKKRCSKGTENAVTASVIGDEGTGISREVKERAGKPTLSGHVPLMPTRLAEVGYQTEKKGVRGRKVQHTKKPKSKGSTTKPLSKGAVKTPGRKKGNSK